MSPTSEGTHLRTSFSTILMSCLCHQGRNQPSGKASKGTLSQVKAVKSQPRGKKSSRHQSKDEVIFDTPGCHFPRSSPSVFRVGRNILEPSSATARTWEQIQSAVRAFSNLSDHELRPSVIGYWFAHLGFVSQVKLFTSSFGENKSLDIFLGSWFARVWVDSPRVFAKSW